MPTPVPDIRGGCIWEADDFRNAYDTWLPCLVNDGSHSILLDLLHGVDFIWDENIPRDADRASDGRYLRLRFSEESGLECPDEALGWPCSFLEFLVALAYSIEDDLMYDPEEEDRSRKWFWLMMENAGLDEFDDGTMLASGMHAYYLVMETVNRILYREYDRDGSKGLFPLKDPRMDQRLVEIWYQANAYFIEEYFE